MPLKQLDASKYSVFMFFFCNIHTVNDCSLLLIYRKELELYLQTLVSKTYPSGLPLVLRQFLHFHLYVS